VKLAYLNLSVCPRSRHRIESDSSPSIRFLFRSFDLVNMIDAYKIALYTDICSVCVCVCVCVCVVCLKEVKRKKLIGIRSWYVPNKGMDYVL